MIHAEAPRRRPWAGIAWMTAFAAGGVVTLINISAGLLLIAFCTVLALVYIARPRLLISRAPAAAQRRPAHIAWQPMAQRTIVTADGAEQSALVAPIGESDGYEMVLTIDGYKLVDQAGRVMYTLKG
jgi:hypothetical protein